MATAELKVRIEAETGELKKGLDEATNLTTKFEKNIGTLTAQLSRLQKLQPFQNSIESFNRGQRAIEATKSQIQSLNAAITGQTFSKLSAGSNQAGFALQNLGRVAQDAPFGFIGIQNNINPLLESFQRLKAESGSTGGAIKALGASLIGSGGLLLAVSLVTSALTVLAQNPEKVAGAINYLSGVVDNATESQKAYNQELIETGAAAKVEVTSLESLIAIARNETLSRNARLEALKKVKAEYPEQLEFLTLETIGSKRASEAIDLLSKSLLRKAKIQAAEKLLGDAFVKQLEATTKTAAEQASTFSKVVGASLGAVGIKNFVVLQNGIENQAKAFNEAGKEITTYSDILNKLKTQEAEAGTLFDDTTKTVKASVPKFDRGALIQAGKTVGVTLSTGISEGFAEVIPVVSMDLGNKLKGGLTEWQTYVNSELLPKVQGNFETFFNDILMRGKLSFDSLGKAILNTFLSIAASEAARSVTNLFRVNTGAEYSATKGKGGGLLSGLVGLLGIGGKAAAAGGGTAAAAGTATAASGGLLLPILGGIAAAASIASLFKKRKAEPQPAFTTSNAISTSSSSNVDFGSGRVVFEISGVNLVGVLNRAGAKLQRFGP